MIQSQNSRSEQKPDRQDQQTLTADLVRQVADRVYALWQRDLQVARERRSRPYPNGR